MFGKVMLARWKGSWCHVAGRIYTPTLLHDGRWFQMPLTSESQPEPSSTL